MTERQTPEELQTLLGDFFKGPVRVFEAGLEDNRPETLQQRPFFSILPDGENIYAEQLAKVPSEQGYTVTIGKPIPGGKLDTEHHAFLQELETRFRNVHPKAKLFIIDPDVIRGRYAMDRTRERSLNQSILGYLQERMEGEQADQEFPVDNGDDKVFGDAALEGNSPFSLPLHRGVTLDNLQGQEQLSIVVASNPDQPAHMLFTMMPGAEERMAVDGLSIRDTQKIVLYHEIGHALDTAKRANPITDSAVTHLLRRHQTECIADAHAVLQMARDKGDTKAGKFLGDVRINNVVDVIESLSPQTERKQKRAGIEGQVWRAHNQREAMLKEHGLAEEDTEQTTFFKKMESTDKLFNKTMTAASGMAYHTTPTIDAAVEFAEQHLKDGSLQEMTDLEVLQAAEDLTAKTAMDHNALIEASMSVTSGKYNDDILKVFPRCQQAIDAMPLSESKIQAAYRKQRAMRAEQRQIFVARQLGLRLMLKEPKPDLTAKKKLAAWRYSLITKIEKKGGTRDDLKDVVTAEKDKLRDSKDKLADQKLKMLNVEFLSDAPQMVAKASARGAVRKELNNIKPREVTETGVDAIASFIRNEMEMAVNAQKGLKVSKGDERAGLSIEELQGLLQTKVTDYKKILQGEKFSQAIAKKIYGDKNAWAIAKQSPKLAEMIRFKSQKRHPEWIDTYHANLAKAATWRTDELKDRMHRNRFKMTNYAQEIPEIAERLAAEHPSVDRIADLSVRDYTASNRNLTLRQKVQAPKDTPNIPEHPLLKNKLAQRQKRR